MENVALNPNGPGGPNPKQLFNSSELMQGINLNRGSLATKRTATQISSKDITLTVLINSLQNITNTGDSPYSGAYNPGIAFSSSDKNGVSTAYVSKTLSGEVFSVFKSPAATGHGSSNQIIPSIRRGGSKR